MIEKTMKEWCDKFDIEFVETLGYADEATKINELTLDRPVLMMCVVGNTTFEQGKFMDFRTVTRRFTLLCSTDEEVQVVKNTDKAMNELIGSLITYIKPSFRNGVSNGYINTKTVVNHLNCMSVAKLFELKFKIRETCQQ